MPALWLCTILLAILSCSARPNMPPGFLVGNAERSPTSRRIDLPKYLQDIQEAVSKAAKEASENAKQHIAAMKKKHMEMIRHHFLHTVAPIKQRLGALNPHWSVHPNVPPCVDCLPIKHNIGSTYPSYTSQTNLSPCIGNIFTCLQAIGLPSYRPTDTFPVNRPCLNNECNQTHKKPQSSKPISTKYPVSKPTVIDNHKNFSSDKNSSNNVYEFSKPTYHIPSTSLPVASGNTEPPKFTLPEKLFNVAMNLTTPATVESTVALEDLRKNSSTLENEILEIEPVELNEHLKESSSILPTEDKLTSQETVSELTTLGRDELKTTISNVFDEQTTTPKTTDFLNTLEEETKTETPGFEMDLERIGAFTTSPSNENQPITTDALGDLKTTYKVNNINKQINQEQATEKTSEWDGTEDSLLLTTTDESLVTTEKLVESVKHHETTIEPSELITDQISTMPVIHEHVNVPTDENSEKAFPEQKVTENPNLYEQETTTETNGADVVVTIEPNLKVYEDSQTEIKTPDEITTSILTTDVSLNKSNSVIDEIPETTTTDSLSPPYKAVSSVLQAGVKSNEDTTDNVEVKTTTDIQDYKDIELELTTQETDSSTNMYEKSDQSSSNDLEETTISTETAEYKTNVEALGVSVELTTQAVKDLISLDHVTAEKDGDLFEITTEVNMDKAENLFETTSENNTEKDEDLFETTNSSIPYNKGARAEDNNIFHTTTDNIDFSEFTVKETTQNFNDKSEITTKEGEYVDYTDANSNTEMYSTKTNVGNQTRSFDSFKEQFSNSNTSEPEISTAAKPEEPMTLPITDYNELIESRTEDYTGFTDSFETTTYIEHYLESSTQPFGKELDELETKNGVIDFSTDSVDKEETSTPLYDLRSNGLSGEMTNYQDGVLKYTTELESETDATPTDDSTAPSVMLSVLQNTLRRARDEPRLSGGFSLSPVQSVKKCIDLVDCLISNNRSKRSLRDTFKSLNNSENKPSFNNTHFSTLSNSPPSNKEKRFDAETSGLNGPAFLELLSVVREGFRNNAFNKDDTEIIRSIFGDLGSRAAVEENVENVKEIKGDLLMKDSTAKLEEPIEDEEYVSYEYADMPREMERLKRSKNYRLMTSLLKTIPNEQKKNLNTKSSPQRKRRDILSSHQISKAASILALLAEQRDVQLDDEEEDYYEYYEDDGNDNAALYQEVYRDEVYEEPSFVELIKLARRHSQRRSRQES